MSRLPHNSSPHLNADLLPVRMCSKFVYCPRLFYLQHVQGLFVESPDTIVGSAQHRARAHRKTKSLLENKASEPLNIPDAIRRSRILESEKVGIRGKLDLLEVGSDKVIVVEYKKGSAPLSSTQTWGEHEIETGAWIPDVVQVGLYMRLLREGNLPCDEARIFYREDRKTVSVPWSTELENLLNAVINECRTTAIQDRPPEPLAYSSKCPRCSLVPVCLPLEHQSLLRSKINAELPASNLEQITTTDEDAKPLPTLPRLIPGRDDVSSVHICSPGATVRKKGESIVVCRRDGTKVSVLGKDIGHLALYGPSQITHQCMLYLTEMGVGVTHHTGSGRLIAMTNAPSTKNIHIRRAQFRTADDERKSLEIARSLVLAKVKNQRTLIRRYRRASEARARAQALPDWALTEDEQNDESEPNNSCRSLADTLVRLRGCAASATKAGNLDTLRGHEGDAAAMYFAALPAILPKDWKQEFCGRTRRPPRDRVNAMLSFGYALLVKDVVNAIVGVGLDPMLGFLHSMIAGRPALALDIMEPFRPAWVDVAVIRLLSTGGIAKDSFDCSDLGVFLSDQGRRRMIAAYERRADEETSHHHFGYRMSYRRMLGLEVRILAKFILGEVEHFPAFLTR